MRRWLVEIYFGDDELLWPLPFDVLHIVLEFSGLIRHSRRSASFFLWGNNSLTVPNHRIPERFYLHTRARAGGVGEEKKHDESG